MAEPASDSSSDRVVCPGDCLGDTLQLNAGKGTFVRNSRIFASLVGEKVVSVESGSIAVSVNQSKPPAVVPAPGDVVMARITRIKLKQAECEILYVGSTPVQEPFPGKIRIQDVRAFEVDSVEIYKSFRPGDIVRATVVCLLIFFFLSALIFPNVFHSCQWETAVRIIYPQQRTIWVSCTQPVRRRDR